METFEVQFGEFLRSARSYMEAYETLRRSISAIVRIDRGVDAFYIGKASGVEATEAIMRRYGPRKTGWELTEQWALFESSSAARVAALEGALNEHYARNDPKRRRGAIFLNTGRGSAGRPSAQPRHYLYIALRRHKLM